MEKSDLLKSIGFSDEFIGKLKEHEENDFVEVKQLPFLETDSIFSVADSTNLFIEDQPRKDSKFLIMK